MKHIRALDGLRGVAILLVIFFHFGYLELGWVGVQLFFVLSGFLITSILLADRQPDLRAYLRRFYLRRSLRIFPLYYGCLALLTFGFLLKQRPEGFGEAAPWLYTYTFNLFRFSPQWINSTFYTHFWSLAVEEQFYLFWPLVVFFLPRRWIVRVAIATICVAPLVRFGLSAYLTQLGRSAFDVGHTVYEFTVSQLDAFAFGALLAAFEPSRVRRPWLLLGLSVGLVAAYGALNAALLAASGQPVPFSSFGYPSYQVANLQPTISYSLIDALAGALILCVVRVPQRFTLLTGRPLVWIGSISYGLYIFHLPLENILSPLMFRYFFGSPLATFVFFLIFLAVALTVAHLSYTLFERPLLRLKDRLAPPRPSRERLAPDVI